MLASKNSITSLFYWFFCYFQSSCDIVLCIAFDICNDFFVFGIAINPTLEQSTLFKHFELFSIANHLCQVLIAKLNPHLLLFAIRICEISCHVNVEQQTNKNSAVVTTLNKIAQNIQCKDKVHTISALASVVDLGSLWKISEVYNNMWSIASRWFEFESNKSYSGEFLACYTIIKINKDDNTYLRLIYDLPSLPTKPDLLVPV